MPWLSIIMAIISFLGTLKKDKSNVGQAALVGAAAGLGTYYVTHETDWGKENLGQFDGVVTGVVGDATTSPTAPTSNSTTSPVTVPVTGTAPSGTASTGGIWDTVKDNLLPVAGGVITGSALSGDGIPSWLIWGVGGLLAYKLFLS